MSTSMSASAAGTNTPYGVLGSIAYQFCKEQPFLVACNLTLALVLAPLGDILLPHLYGKLVSSVEKQGVRQARKGDPTWWPPPHVAGPAMWVLVALAGSQIGWLLKDALDMHTTPLLENMVRTRMVEGLVTELDGNLPGPTPSGHYLGQIARTPESAAWWWHVLLDYAIPYGITLVGSVFYYAGIDLGLTACLIALIVAVVFLLVVSPTYCGSAAVKRDKALNDIHDRTDDLFSNLASVYGGGVQEREVSEIRDMGIAFKAKHIAAVSCIMWYKGTGVPLLVAFVGLVVLRSCHLTAVGKMTPGLFVSVFMITTSLLGTLAWLLGLVRAGTLDHGNMQSVFNDFFSIGGRRPNVPSHESVLRQEAGQGTTGLALIDVSYGPLSHVSVSFPSGRVNMVSRPVGWGKSTMLRLMAGLIVPDSGDLEVDGLLYSEIGLSNVRKLVAYMPQDAHLFNRTVFENVTLGMNDRAPTRAEVIELAEKLGMWGVLSENLSNGIDTDVGKGGAKLSGGQKQLVWLLRIATRVILGAHRVSAILLDEPSASLDAKSRDVSRRVLTNLLDLRPEMTVVVVDHLNLFSDGSTTRPQ